MLRSRGFLRAVVLSVVTVLAVAGCASGAGSARGDEPRDAAGLTRAEVAEASLEEEFGLASERYSEIEGVLEEAQLQVSEGAWRWNGGDVLPSAGGPGSFGEPLPGPMVTTAITSVWVGPFGRKGPPVLSLISSR
jgi:hypothetical protein